MILLNYSMGAMLNSLYFCGLFLADIIRVNVLFWSISPVCLFLKIIHYNSIRGLYWSSYLKQHLWYSYHCKLYIFLNINAFV